MRSIDIAWLQCPKCKHRCTPPPAINCMASQMELYGELLPNADEAKVKTDIEKLHKGNKCTIETRYRQDPADPTKAAVDKKVVKLARSYAEATGDSTVLEESNHIVLACPQCKATLYEARWGLRR